MLLRHYLEQGLSEFARTLHVSRRTVYHWINIGQLARELDDGRCSTRRGSMAMLFGNC